MEINIYMAALFTLPEPHVSSLVSMVTFKDWSLAVATIFAITHTTDGGTLPDQVTGFRVRVSDSLPIMSQVLTFQD